MCAFHMYDIEINVYGFSVYDNMYTSIIFFFKSSPKHKQFYFLVFPSTHLYLSSWNIYKKNVLFFPSFFKCVILSMLVGWLVEIISSHNWMMMIMIAHIITLAHIILSDNYCPTTTNDYCVYGSSFWRLWLLLLLLLLLHHHLWCEVRMTSIYPSSHLCISQFTSDGLHPN